MQIYKKYGICEGIIIENTKIQIPNTKYQGGGIACKWWNYVGKFDVWEDMTIWQVFYLGR